MLSYIATELEQAEPVAPAERAAVQASTPDRQSDSNPISQPSATSGGSGPQGGSRRARVRLEAELTAVVVLDGPVVCVQTTDVRASRACLHDRHCA